MHDALHCSSVCACLPLESLRRVVPRLARTPRPISTCSFPVPVQGKLAVEMQRLIEQFDKRPRRHPCHRRLYRQLRRHQPEDARRDPGRPSAGAR